MSKILIAAGANINSKDHNGNTPLHNAALDITNPEIFKILIENGAHVHEKNYKVVQAFEQDRIISDIGYTLIAENNTENLGAISDDSSYEFL